MANYTNIGYIEILSGGAGNPRTFAGIVDPSAGAGVPAQEGSLFQRFGVGAGQLWLKTGAADTAWTRLTTGAGGAVPIGWGNFTVGSEAETRFIPPGYGQTDGTDPATTDIYQQPFAVPGTIDQLYVRHNVAVGNGASVDYTVMLNGVATVLTVSLATGAVGQASDLINSFVVAAGDRVSLRAVKAQALQDGAVHLNAGVRFTPT